MYTIGQSDISEDEGVTISMEVEWEGREAVELSLERLAEVLEKSWLFVSPALVAFL